MSLWTQEPRPILLPARLRLRLITFNERCGRKIKADLLFEQTGATAAATCETWRWQPAALIIQDHTFIPTWQGRRGTIWSSGSLRDELKQKTLIISEFLSCRQKRKKNEWGGGGGVLAERLQHYLRGMTSIKTKNFQSWKLFKRRLKLAWTQLRISTKTS